MTEYRASSGSQYGSSDFEGACFAMRAFLNPAASKSEDPYWDPEDARYSVIRYLPSTIENASGPHVSDPRTGEILESDIQYYLSLIHISEPTRQAEISYAVFCLKKKKK